MARLSKQEIEPVLNRALRELDIELDDKSATRLLVLEFLQGWMTMVEVFERLERKL
jgi:hypothetical protein